MLICTIPHPSATAPEVILSKVTKSLQNLRAVTSWHIPYWAPGMWGLLIKNSSYQREIVPQRMMRDVLPLLLNTLFTDAMHPTHSHACEDPRDTWNEANLLGQWSQDKEEPPGALRSVRGKLRADTLTQSADKLLSIAMPAVKLMPRVHCCCGISAPPVATSALWLRGVSTEHRNAARQAKLPATSQTGKARLWPHSWCNFVCLIKKKKMHQKP